jgi:hypothetical protein
MINAADEYGVNSVGSEPMKPHTHINDSFLGAAIGMISVQPTAAPQIGPTLGLSNALQNPGLDITRTPRGPSGLDG